MDPNISYAVLVVYAGSATLLAATAAVQSWRHRRRGYAVFACAVSVLAVVVGATTIHLRPVG